MKLCKNKIRHSYLFGDRSRRRQATATATMLLLQNHYQMEPDPERILLLLLLLVLIFLILLPALLAMKGLLLMEVTRTLTPRLPTMFP